MSSEPCDAGVEWAEATECWETEWDEVVPDWTLQG